jgi:hypothetical protein
MFVSAKIFLQSCVLLRAYSLSVIMRECVDVSAGMSPPVRPRLPLVPPRVPGESETDG